MVHTTKIQLLKKIVTYKTLEEMLIGAHRRGYIAEQLLMIEAYGSKKYPDSMVGPNQAIVFKNREKQLIGFKRLGDYHLHKYNIEINSRILKSLPKPTTLKTLSALYFCKSGS